MNVVETKIGHAVPYVLSAAERERFSRVGWLGPYPLPSPDEAHDLAAELQRAFDQTLGHH